MAVNKVIYAGEVLIDLTDDTITPDGMLENLRAHQADGTVISGTIKQDQIIPTGATERSVSQSINDVDNDSISDSDGNTIYGKNVYRLA